MSTAHTKGRLIVKGRYSVCTEDGETEVANTRWTTLDSSNDEANARRIAACWNACDGIETSALELMVGDLSIKEQITASGKAKPRPATHRAIVYRQQRDELLKALKSAWLWMENQSDAQSKGGHATFDLMMLRYERDMARASIAKAEGGEA